MKRTSILLAALLLLSVSLTFNACAQNEQVPEAVKTAFTQKFAHAQKVKWDHENANEFEANFTLNGTEMSASYHPDGTWMETETSSTFSDLPKAVQDAVLAHHEKDDVAEVAVIENAKGKLYEVEIRSAEEQDEEDEGAVVEYQYTADGKLVNTIKHDNEEND